MGVLKHTLGKLIGLEGDLKGDRKAWNSSGMSSQEIKRTVERMSAVSAGSKLRAADYDIPQTTHSRSSPLIEEASCN